MNRMGNLSELSHQIHGNGFHDELRHLEGSQEFPTLLVFCPNLRIT
jgi:hypothetical protein